MKYYLIGIKGSGMSALATCLKEMNEEVMGSDDINDYFTMENLNKHNIEVLVFSKKNIEKNKNCFFIIGYSYNELNNEEVSEVFKNNLKYLYYSDFINYYFHSIKIGVSGTHGKTTTTSLITHILKENPICSIIGDGSGRGDKNYKYFIFEACEYKLHFLKYDFDYLIINNIDYDHPDCFTDIEDVGNAFKKASKLAKVIITNNDDPILRTIPHPSKYTFAIDNNAFVRLYILKEKKTGYKVKITVKNEVYIYDLPLFGKHMLYNFLASFTLYYLLKGSINSVEIIKNISSFKPSKRRLEKVAITSPQIIKNKITIINDYAHHPKEIKASLSALAQKYRNKKIIVIFQPHTYSRTIFLSEEFMNCFLLYETYICKTFTSVREEKDLQKEKTVATIFDTYKKYEENTLEELIKRKNIVIVFMGAGDIYKEINKLGKLEKK